MASNINTTDIDETYPVAGQDNDSQGFRDNFSTIKDNFSAAAAEIETLQTNTAKLNALNDFSNNTITNAVLIKNTEEVFNSGNLLNGQNVSFNNGHYQTAGIDGDFTLTLSDWPATGYLGKIRIVLTGEGDIQWSTEAGGAIRYDSAFPHVDAVSQRGKVTLSSTTVARVFDFWTGDAGITVYAQHVGDYEV